MVHEAFQAGVRHFGENRVQEAEGKLAAAREMRAQMTWHMIGRLQGNKVKAAATLFDMIHSIDSVKLGEALNRRVARQMPVLLEVNVAGELTKRGFAPAEVSEAVRLVAALGNIDVRGLMTVAPATAEPEEARPFFRRLRDLATELGLPELSMGMTGDFEVAVEEGATMVRIGKGIFGISGTAQQR